MKWLNHDKTRTWIIYFILSVMILLVLAAIGYSLGRWYIEPSAAESRTHIDLYSDIPLDATLLPIDRKALDEAYHAHLIKLFTIWLTDGAKDSSRFRNGLRISRGAYQEAVQAIAKREQELKQREQK